MRHEFDESGEGFSGLFQLNSRPALAADNQASPNIVSCPHADAERPRLHLAVVYKEAADRFITKAAQLVTRGFCHIPRCLGVAQALIFLLLFLLFLVFVLILIHTRHISFCHCSSRRGHTTPSAASTCEGAGHQGIVRVGAVARALALLAGTATMLRGRRRTVAERARTWLKGKKEETESEREMEKVIRLIMSCALEQPETKALHLTP